jgi:hypothetical protein
MIPGLGKRMTSKEERQGQRTIGVSRGKIPNHQREKDRKT